MRSFSGSGLLSQRTTSIIFENVVWGCTRRSASVFWLRKAQRTGLFCCQWSLKSKPETHSLSFISLLKNYFNPSIPCFLDLLRFTRFHPSWSMRVITKTCAPDVWQVGRCLCRVDIHYALFQAQPRPGFNSTLIELAIFPLILKPTQYKGNFLARLKKCTIRCLCSLQI